MKSTLGIHHCDMFYGHTLIDKQDPFVSTFCITFPPHCAFQSNYNFTPFSPALKVLKIHIYIFQGPNPENSVFCCLRRLAGSLGIIYRCVVANKISECGEGRALLGGKGLANFLKFQNLSFLGMRTNL